MKHQSKAFIFASFLSIATFSHAGTIQSTFQVSVTVVDDCRIQSPDMAFPQYSSSQASTTATSLSVTCTRGTEAKVATTSPMTLTDGKGNTINYELSSGGGSLSNGVSIIGQGSTPVLVPVQGLIPQGQVSPPGLYQGQQVVTVTF